jgi:hypothetical protein
MNIPLFFDALADLEEGFSCYRQQAAGLGSYFIACLTADIESLAYYEGIHQIVYGIAVEAPTTGCNMMLAASRLQSTRWGFGLSSSNDVNPS